MVTATTRPPTVTMKVRPTTWEALSALKRHGDTFDDVIRRLLDHEEEREGAGESK